MKKIQLSVCLLYCIGVFAQSPDTVLVTSIVNLQLRIADQSFKRTYVLDNSSMPFDTTKSYYNTGGEFTTFVCGKYVSWNKFRLHSKFSSVETDTTTYKEYSCFISTPVFNAKKTKCRLTMSTHYSEWGGYTGCYYYQKRGRKWKLVKHTVAAIYC
ncbi:MAG: hypothetical protein ACJ77K_13585 [Bacteroidia bacterium]|jgi:hypothetical protein